MEEVRNLIKNINRKKLTNNTQKALLSLLIRNGKWVARTALQVPNVSSRFRDLRKELRQIKYDKFSSFISTYTFGRFCVCF